MGTSPNSLSLRRHGIINPEIEMRARVDSSGLHNNSLERTPPQGKMHLKLAPRRTGFFVYDESGAAQLAAVRYPTGLKPPLNPLPKILLRLQRKHNP